MKYKSSLIVLIISGVLLVASLVVFMYSKNAFNVREAQARAKIAEVVLPIQLEERDLEKNRGNIRTSIMRQSQKDNNITKQGFVSIPELGILLPIFDDAYSEASLSDGANIVKTEDEKSKTLKSQIENYNVFYLAGHNYNDGVTAFSALQETMNDNYPYLVNGNPNSNDWLKGKKLYLADDEYIYEFEIGIQETISGNDWSIAKGDTKYSLKLISCLYPNSAYRIITNASLITKYSWGNVPLEVLNYFDLQRQSTNAYPAFTEQVEEGANGSAGGTR